MICLRVLVRFTFVVPKEHEGHAAVVVEVVQNTFRVHPVAGRFLTYRKPREKFVCERAT